MRAVCVMAAPNGARRGKDLHPALPISIEETAAEAAACAAAGAGALHLHVRDAAGGHSLDAGLYCEAIAAVRAAAPSLAIQITTEAAGIFGWEAQFACLRAVVPDNASLAIREALRAPEAEARALYAWAREAGIGLQHILYTPDDARLLADAVARGVVPGDRHAVIFVLGAYAPPRDGKPEELVAFREALGGLACDWMTCCFGPHEHAASRAAIAAGGHVRVGFENNIHLPDGSVAPSTAALVAGIAEEVRSAGHTLGAPAALGGPS